MKGQQVVLIPQADPTTGVIQWTMVHDGYVAQGGNYPAVDMPKGNQNDNIIFTIVDINKLGVSFDPKVIDNGSHPKALNAIWIATPSGAQKKEGAYPAQIDSVKLQNGNSQLIVGDKNSDDSVMTYQLNFLRGGQPVTSIDPEIRNGGGTKAQFISMETVAVVLGLAVLALVGLQWFTQMRLRGK